MQYYLFMRTKQKIRGRKNSHRCVSGKVRYPDHEYAVSVLHKAQNSAKRSLEERGTTRRHEQRAYFCAECQGFHLTSKPMRFTVKDWDLAA